MFFSKNVDLRSSPGPVVMGGDSYYVGCGFDPHTVYWMDIFHINLLQNL